MLAQWTGELIGKLHNHQITCKELAAKLGVHEKYVSAVLNCKKTPKDAEQRFNAALDELIAERAS